MISKPVLKGILCHPFSERKLAGRKKEPQLRGVQWQVRAAFVSACRQGRIHRELCLLCLPSPSTGAISHRNRKAGMPGPIISSVFFALSRLRLATSPV
jgi:hypothetical protein